MCNRGTPVTLYRGNSVPPTKKSRGTDAKVDEKHVLPAKKLPPTYTREARQMMNLAEVRQAPPSDYPDVPTIAAAMTTVAPPPPFSRQRRPRHHLAVASTLVLVSTSDRRERGTGLRAPRSSWRRPRCCSARQTSRCAPRGKASRAAAGRLAGGRSGRRRLSHPSSGPLSSGKRRRIAPPTDC